MTLLIGAWTVGLILALLALGVYISFRIFRFPDITADGSITYGAAVSAILMTEGFHPLLSGMSSLWLWPAAWVPAPQAVNPVVATFLAFVAGCCAGAVTGTLHTRYKINPLLSGILVMTALYTVNIRTMGKANLSLSESTTLKTYVENTSTFLMGKDAQVPVFYWTITGNDLIMLILTIATVALVGAGLYAFFRTELGTAMRATGDNDQMIRALGVNVDRMIVVGLALSNGLIALSGSLFAQMQGFADLQMGIGMVVLGLASVIIGEALVGGQHNLGFSLIGAVMGSVLFRLLQALVLRFGLNATDMKLITAVFVFLALVMPALLARLKGTQKGQAQHA